ncbi:hypothetical protein LQ938_10260 [Microbacterium sp. cx-55]|uniref:hypothetical protein n=1 Tax=Microbacterium sp. cx-55 TaxID=2875948 RepID=UPI001CBCB37F|nr:hypothetical protein [Microbacterium sp. cx-55]MBZ4485856.1 hypothetical protein [Microbacterium sp. cx-55]UGB34267.1 hypothetical protein LQ938_10260 [Microbacterium sp. cx-55]
MDGQGEQATAAYVLPDPQLRTYDRGLGTLRVEGEIEGYLASIVGKMRFPSAQVWPWFVVVWIDGTKGDPFEDYGPHWWTVRELNAGYLQHYGRSVTSGQRFFGKRFAGSVAGPPRRFEFEWLPRAEAASKWQELGLVDTDF